MANISQETRTTEAHQISQSIIPWAASALFYVYVNLLTVSLCVLRHDISVLYQLQDYQIGQLTSAFFLGYACMQIPVGWLIDRYPVKYCINIGALISLIGLAIFSYAPNFMLLLIGRSITGIGLSFGTLSALNISAVYFPARYFSTLMGILLTLGAVGSMLGQAPLNTLLYQVGYHNTLLCLLGLGIAIQWLLWLLIPLRHTPSEQKQVSHSTFDMFTNLNVWTIMMYGALMYGPYQIFQADIGIPYLMESQFLDHYPASQLTSFMVIGMMIGSPVIGSLSDLYQSKKIFLFLSSAFTTLALLCMLYIPGLSQIALSALLFMIGFATSGSFISFNVLKMNVPITMAAFAMGLMNTINTLPGVALGPYIGYAVSYAVEQGKTLPYTNSLMVLPIIAFLATVLSLFIKENKE
jgi:predicted MFS family arabinose efflux permease